MTPLIKRTPRRIEPHSPTEILVEWSDSQLYSLPYLELRYQCPCASCVDELTGRRVLKKEDVRPDVRPVKVEQVGRYAIRVAWSDGHSTGMYPFDRLDELCVKFGKPL